MPLLIIEKSWWSKSRPLQPTSNKTLFNQHNIAALFFIVFNLYLRVVTGRDTWANISTLFWNFQRKKRVPKFSFLSVGDRMQTPVAKRHCWQWPPEPRSTESLHLSTNSTPTLAVARSAVLVETLVNAQLQTFSMSYDTPFNKNTVFSYFSVFLWLH